jgi:two-component system alkaline phosphatase synthesis response regulator PhoP
LSRVFIIANEREQARQLRAELAQRGLDCLIIPSKDGAIEQIAGQSPGLLLLDADEAKFGSEAWELAQRIRQERHIPIIALVSGEKLNGFDFSTGIDDFVVKPWEASEVTARIKRILRQKGGVESEDIIRCGDLVIDSVKCEVLLGGKPIILTFKEYQLLKFLANNKGKVFTRDVLLDKVWGWDYYGGDRTVDVHIRRLRSKIEDSTHTFIETVRNVGYKFKEL